MEKNWADMYLKIFPNYIIYVYNVIPWNKLILSIYIPINLATIHIMILGALEAIMQPTTDAIDEMIIQGFLPKWSAAHPHIRTPNKFPQKKIVWASLGKYSAGPHTRFHLCITVFRKWLVSYSKLENSIWIIKRFMALRIISIYGWSTLSTKNEFMYENRLWKILGKVT